jgi:hypothetical protein
MAGTLTQLFDLIGIPEETRTYLTEGLNYKIPEVIAKVGKTDEEFATGVVDALTGEGVTIRTIVYKFTPDDNPGVVRAQLACLWDKCQQESARIAEAAKPKSEAPATTVAQAMPRFDPNKNKPPKFLEPGVWQQSIDAYEKEWQNKRKFPYKILVGAEEILARLIWEKDTSKIFTPLKMGEVMAARSYNSCGKINHWASEKSTKEVLQLTKGGTDSAEFVAKEWTFTPKSLEMIQDALDAVKWAFVFAGYGNDVVVGEWTDKFVINLRTKKIPALTKDLYEEASLSLALEMREGKTFEAATAALLKDGPWWSDYVANWSPKERGIKRDSDGYEKRNQGGDARKKAEVCRYWIKGTCKKGRDCDFQHSGGSSWQSRDNGWNKKKELGNDHWKKQDGRGNGRKDRWNNHKKDHKDNGRHEKRSHGGRRNNR